MRRVAPPAGAHRPRGNESRARLLREIAETSLRFATPWLARPQCRLVNPEVRRLPTHQEGEAPPQAADSCTELEPGRNEADKWGLKAVLQPCHSDLAVVIGSPTPAWLPRASIIAFKLTGKTLDVLSSDRIVIHSM